MFKSKKMIFAAALYPLILGMASLTLADEPEKNVKVIKLHNTEEIPVDVMSRVPHKIITLNLSDLEDSDALAEQLGDLDEDTRTSVLDAVQKLQSGEKSDFTMLKVKDGDLVNVKAKVMKIHTDGSLNIDGTDDARVVISTPETVLKGHSDAIIKLIERGEFSREELEEIRAALDKKW